MSVTHTYVSPAAPTADPTLVGSQHWNAGHTVSIVNADVNPAAAIVESKLALNFPTHAAATIGAPANGLSILGQVISLGLASAGVTGALDGADWSTFNSKQAALTFPLAANLGGTGVANAIGSTLTLGGAVTISTGGTIALGGFTLTVPATGIAALLATANVFTVQQMVDGSADEVQLRVQANAVQTSYLQVWEKNGGTVYSGVQSNGILFSSKGDSLTNTIIGIDAGQNIVAAAPAGVESTFVGNEAGKLTTSGKQNTALGFQALGSNLTGDSNNAIGYRALQRCLSSNNNAMGQEALAGLTSGGSNNAMGYGALFTVSTGSRNCAVGYNALRLTTGNDNVGIGYRAGNSNTGNRSIFIGRDAGYNSTASNLLVIHNQDQVSAAYEVANSIIYGVMGALASNQTLAFNAVSKVAVNTTTTNAPLNVFDLNAYVSTAATGFANGGGVGMTFTAETATDGTSQLQAAIASTWIDSTNATRKAKLSLYVYDTAQRLGMEIEASGAAAKLAFYGGTTVVRGAALTAADAGVVNSGDATTDGVINNMRIRIGELEARLGSATGVNLFA